MASWSRRKRSRAVGDVARVIREALRGVVRGRVALGTVTAPGGTFDTVEAAAWNLAAAGEWRRLRDRIKREMARRHGLRPPVVLVRVAQRQSRGLDHLHICWWLHSAEHERRIRVWIELYREYALRPPKGVLHSHGTSRARGTGRAHGTHAARHGATPHSHRAGTARTPRVT